MADVSITAANVKVVSGTPKIGKAGASVTAGQPLYQDTDTSLKPAKADAAGTATCVGIALNSASTGQTVAYLDNGVLAAGGTLVMGKPYVVSAANAGGIAPVADLTSTNVATYIGIGLTTANLTVAINPTGLVLA